MFKYYNHLIVVMINDLIRKVNDHFKHYIVYVSLVLATVFSSSAYADGILKGTRGPTNWQVDERVVYSKNEKDIETITNNLTLKYWNGDEFGGWGFVSVPYKIINSPEGFNNGLGDITVGIGPRGRINNLYWLSYGALTLPTGISEGKVQLGTGRVDTKFGILITYLTSNKKFEVDGSFEYNVTRENKKGTNPPNETSIGLLSGGEIIPRVRVGVGITDLIRENGDFLLNFRYISRYTFSPQWHLELIVDKGVDSKTLPKGTSIGLSIRYNF